MLKSYRFIKKKHLSQKDRKNCVCVEGVAPKLSEESYIYTESFPVDSFRPEIHACMACYGILKGSFKKSSKDLQLEFLNKSNERLKGIARYVARNGIK